MTTEVLTLIFFLIVAIIAYAWLCHRAERDRDQEAAARHREIIDHLRRINRELARRGGDE